MKILYHPEFPEDVLRLVEHYGAVSPRLGARFRLELDEALEQIKTMPAAAGHFVNTGSLIVKDVRRRNLVAFPYFVLYGLQASLLVFGALIPSASDPLTWLNRFSNPGQ